MFFPLGALGSFGSGAVEGFDTGMDLMDKYRTQKGQADFMQALQQAQLGGAENLTPQSGFTPDPGVSSERSQMPTPQAPMAPMQPGMAPPQGGFAGSIPGAQAPPQQPGGAQPPGVPPMQRMASADPSGGMSPIDSPHVLAVKGFEGYSPRATWDYKQYSGGYGTRATPGQQFTPQSADSAFQDEMWKAKVAVDNFAPGLPQGPRDALTSLTYNAGSSWMKDRLGKAVRAGDMQTAAQLLQQYNHAGGRPLPGLTQRRQEEGRWMLGQPPSPQALAAGRQAEARAAGQPQGQGAPDRTDAAVLSKAVENLRSGNLLPLQQMAQLIERANPGASPQVKFQALKQGLSLMNQSGQTQFNQMMQIMQFQQRQQQHEDVLKHQRTMEELAAGRQDPEKQAALAAAKKGATAIIQSRQRELSTLNTQLGAIEGQTQNMLGNIDRLAAIAKEVQITGSMPIDTWINNIKAKFGNTNALMYKAQLDTTRLDVSRVLNNPTGNAALTEGARKEAQAYLNGVLTPKTIAAFKELYRVDAKIKRESLTNQIKAAEKDIEEYGGHRTTEPAETTAGQAAPATSRKIDREKAKAAGWSDAEIDAYERGQ